MPYFGDYALCVLEFTGRKIANKNFEDFPSPVIIAEENKGGIQFLSVEEFGQLMGGN